MNAESFWTDADVGRLVSEWRNAKPAAIGLNPFLIGSEGDMSETAHSYAIKEFLDHKWTDVSGLSVFRDYLVGLAEKRGQDKVAGDLAGLDLTSGISVKVEEPTRFRLDNGRCKSGRIDILVEANDYSWAIIIENKIKGALDMPRQLYRYVNGETGTDRHRLNVKAIVYVKAQSDDVDCPAFGEDRWAVAPLFIPVAALKQNDDARGLSLVDGWLSKLRSDRVLGVADNWHPNGDDVVSLQYEDVLKKLWLECSRDEDFKCVLDRLHSCGCQGNVFSCKNCPQDVRNEVGLFMARMLARKVARGEFSSSEVYRRNKTVVVYDSMKLFVDDGEERYLGLKLDVKCGGVANDGRVRLRLFSEKCCCSEEEGKCIRKAIPAIKEIVKACVDKCEGLQYAKTANEVTGYEFAFSLTDEKVNWNVGIAEKCLADFIAALSDKRDDLEKIVKESCVRG